MRALDEWRKAAARIVIYFHTEGEIERFREIIGDAALWQGVDLVEGTLARGFCFPAAISLSFRRPNCLGVSLRTPCGD